MPRLQFTSRWLMMIVLVPLALTASALIVADWLGETRPAKLLLEQPELLPLTYVGILLLHWVGFCYLGQRERYGAQRFSSRPRKRAADRPS